MTLLPGGGATCRAEPWGWAVAAAVGRGRKPQCGPAADGCAFSCTAATFPTEPGAHMQQRRLGVQQAGAGREQAAGVGGGERSGGKVCCGQLGGFLQRTGELRAPAGIQLAHWWERERRHSSPSPWLPGSRLGAAWRMQGLLLKFARHYKRASTVPTRRSPFGPIHRGRAWPLYCNPRINCALEVVISLPTKELGSAEPSTNV